MMTSASLDIQIVISNLKLDFQAARYPAYATRAVFAQVMTGISAAVFPGSWNDAAARGRSRPSRSSRRRPPIASNSLPAFAGSQGGPSFVRRRFRRPEITDDPPVVDFDDPVAAGGDMSVVGDDQKRRPAFPVDLPQQRLDGLARFGVEISGRLVGQDETRFIDEGPGDGHPLLLSAGQGV